MRVHVIIMLSPASPPLTPPSHHPPPLQRVFNVRARAWAPRLPGTYRHIFDDGRNAARIRPGRNINNKIDVKTKNAADVITRPRNADVFKEKKVPTPRRDLTVYAVAPGPYVNYSDCYITYIMIF